MGISLTEPQEDKILIYAGLKAPEKKRKKKKEEEDEKEKKKKTLLPRRIERRSNGTASPRPLKSSMKRGKTQAESGKSDMILFMEMFDLPNTIWPHAWRMWTTAFRKRGGAETLRKKLEEGNLSPKLMAMLDNIKKLDEADRQTDGKLYKHAIFVSTRKPTGAGGPLAVGSCLAALGWTWVQNYRLDLDEHQLRSNSNYKFCVLTKENLPGNERNYKNSGSDMIRIRILGDTKEKEWCELSAEKKARYKKGLPPYSGLFNDRELNRHGEMCRFMLFDRKYTEGVDMYDVKYFHVLTPQTSTCLFNQAMGRVARYCGMAGLPFLPPGKDSGGWRVKVFVYEGRFDPTENVNVTKPFELAQRFTNKLENLPAINKILNVMAEISVDRAWNADVNPPKISWGMEDRQETLSGYLLPPRERRGTEGNEERIEEGKFLQETKRRYEEEKTLSREGKKALLDRKDEEVLREVAHSERSKPVEVLERLVISMGLNLDDPRDMFKLSEKLRKTKDNLQGKKFLTLLPEESHWFLLALAGNNEDIASFLLTEILREKKLNFYRDFQAVENEIRKNFKANSFPVFLSALNEDQRTKLNRQAAASGLDPADQMAKFLLENEAQRQTLPTAKDVLVQAIERNDQESSSMMEDDEIMQESRLSRKMDPSTLALIRQITGPITESQLNNLLEMVVNVNGINPYTTAGLNRLVEKIAERMK